MKQRVFVILSVVTLLLAACGGASQATQPATAEIAAPTQPVEPSPAAATEPATAPSDPPAGTKPVIETALPATQPGAVSGGATVYRIVPGESQVTYEVGETFLDQNRFAVAVGATSVINGDVSLDLANPQAAQVGEITVDISQLTSDSSRRDNMLRERFLLSSQFPIAKFIPTSIDGLPAAYTEGEEITFKVTGDLTVAETTRPVTFDVSAKVQGGELSGAAVAMIKMSDFGVGPINMAVLRTEDDVKLTMIFVARP